jgi:hypothetical protein
VTIWLEEEVVDYFRALSVEAVIPYQSLINLLAMNFFTGRCSPILLKLVNTLTGLSRDRTDYGRTTSSIWQ